MHVGFKTYRCNTGDTSDESSLTESEPQTDDYPVTSHIDVDIVN